MAKDERFVRLCGLRARVESMTLLTGEGEGVRLGLYSEHQALSVEVGRSVADGLRLGDGIQIWIEQVQP